LAKKKFDFTEWWGQQLFRGRSNQKDYIWALIRRKYGENDIERKGGGMNIGVQEEEIFEMETDKDPESETFGKRIPRTKIVYDTAGNQKEIPMPIETRLRPIHEATAKNIADYKKLIGFSSIFGNTQFYFVIRGKKYTVDNEEDFWTTTIPEAKKKMTPTKTTPPNPKFIT